MSQTHNAQTEIERLIEKYIDGINRSQSDALIPLFTHDGVIMAADAPTMTGAEQLKAFFGQNFGMIKLAAKIFVDEIVVSGDHAFARTHSQVKVTLLPGGDTHDEENRELFLCERDGGAWKISRYMFNKLPSLK